MNGRKGVAKKTDMDGVDAVLERFEGQQYIADRSIGMAVFLAVRMGKPLLVEGEPGCGKTEIARTLAAALETELIRLQCYEGLDADSTLYEWNHPKQLLTIRIEEARKDTKALEREIFSEEFLLKRPLLQALTHEGPRAPVLLIDEIDRAEDDFVKRPGISETLEWASALMTLGTTKLDRDIVEQTLGFVVKDAQDLQTMQSGRLDALLGSP